MMHEQCAHIIYIYISPPQMSIKHTHH